MACYNRAFKSFKTFIEKNKHKTKGNIAQLKREASAITYAAEIGHEDGTSY
jgi:hypothetical protein